MASRSVIRLRRKADPCRRRRKRRGESVGTALLAKQPATAPMNSSAKRRGGQQFRARSEGTSTTRLTAGLRRAAKVGPYDEKRLHPDHSADGSGTRSARVRQPSVSLSSAAGGEADHGAERDAQGEKANGQAAALGV